MTVRIIETDSSIWTIDFDRMEFRRDPKVVDFEHPIVSYTGEWMPFVDFMDGDPECPPDRTRFWVFQAPNGGDWITSTYLTEAAA